MSEITDVTSEMPVNNANYIRVSSAGGCPRQLQFNMWNPVKADEEIPESSIRAFAEGNLHEDSILLWASEHAPGGPYVLHDQQKEVPIYYNDKLLLLGHIDALATNPVTEETVLFEAKALSRNFYLRMEYEGVFSASPKYYTQVQLYLHGLGLEKAFLIARNKETPKDRFWDHYCEEIIYDPDFVQSELERLNDLQEKIIKHIEVPPPYKTPEESPECLTARCPYLELCFPDYVEPQVQPVPSEHLLDVVEEYNDLTQQIKELEKQRDALKEALMATAKDNPIKVGDYIVAVKQRQNERVDTKKARSVLPQDLLQQIIVVTTYQVLEVKKEKK